MKRVSFPGCRLPADEIDALLEKGRTEPDHETRHEIYRETEKIIAQKALLIPLFHQQAYGFARPEVEGFEVTFCLPFIAYEKLSFRKA